jgi:predicted ATP-dependent endonuclease of OLD family
MNTDSSENKKLYEYLKSIELNPNLSSNLGEVIFKDQAGEQSETLKNLSKINIFVGANNTRKSRFLREVLKGIGRSDFYKKGLEQLSILLENKGNLITNIFNRQVVINKEGQPYYPISSINNFNQNDLINPFNLFKNRIKDKNYAEVEKLIKDEKFLLSILQNIEIIVVYNTNSGINISVNENNLIDFKEYFNQNLSDIFNLFNQIKTLIESDLKKIYVPNVRTMRNYEKGTLEEIINLETVRPLSQHTKDKYGFDENIIIQDGQNLFADFFNKRNSSNDNLDKIKKYQNFLSEVFFEGQPVEMITDIKDKHINLKIGEEKDRLIYELGDGIQQIISLTYPLFFYEYGIMLIEEPEMWIHPGLQKRLMKVFYDSKWAKDNKYSYSENFVFFIATHSNHIVDSINDTDLTSLFLVKKQQQKLILNHIPTGNKNILDELGVSNSSLFLANCVIWVEGISDKIYFNSYLKAFLNYLKNVENEIELKEEKEIWKKLKNKNLIEGIHYCFAFSGGNNLFHLDFSENEEAEKDVKESVIIRFLCNRNMVIVDNDNEKNSYLKKVLKDNLGNNFHELEVREVENLLPMEIIAKALPSLRKSLKNIESSVFLTQLTNNKNFEPINGKLGQFLNNKIKRFLVNNNINTELNFKGDSGSIKDKTDLAIASAPIIEEMGYQKMTPEAKKTAIKMLEFICRENNFN